MRIARLGIATLLVLALAVAVAPAARANGGAVKMPLKYLASVSNWGPTSASGIGSVDVSDGEVIVTASGLPRLSAERYEGWLITGADLVSVGRFNADASGVVQFRVILSGAVSDIAAVKAVGGVSGTVAVTPAVQSE